MTACIRQMKIFYLVHFSCEVPGSFFSKGFWRVEFFKDFWNLCFKGRSNYLKSLNKKRSCFFVGEG